MAASTPDGSQQWILIGASAIRQREVTQGIVKMVVPIVQYRRKQVTEQSIETLVRLYLEGEELAAADRAVERKNAELRACFLRDVPTYTAADIHEIMQFRAGKVEARPHLVGSAKEGSLPFR